jgi:hypothetical protein
MFGILEQSDSSNSMLVYDSLIFVIGLLVDDKRTVAGSILTLFF